MLDSDVTKNKAMHSDKLPPHVNCPRCDSKYVIVFDNSKFIDDTIHILCMNCDDRPREITRKELDALLSK